MSDYPRADPIIDRWFPANVAMCKNCGDVITWDGVEWVHQFDMISNCCPIVEE